MNDESQAVERSVASDCSAAGITDDTPIHKLDLPEEVMMMFFHCGAETVKDIKNLSARDVKQRRNRMGIKSLIALREQLLKCDIEWSSDSELAELMPNRLRYMKQLYLDSSEEQKAEFLEWLSSLPS